MRYFKGLIKSLFRWSNIGTFIFFLLNAGMILALFSSTGTEALPGIFVLYIISLLVALSPVGEAILGFMSGARNMTRVDMRNRIEPLLRRVHNKALEKTPELTRKINLKVMYDPNPNAFALGRRTICVTEGLFSLPDEMIEGILAHEMAHLAYHHTDMQLLIGGGNFIITFVIFIFKFIAWMFGIFGLLFSLNRNTRDSGSGAFIFSLIISGIIWLWTKFCTLFLMWSSRANEYVADKYAMEIGYGYELAAALDSIGGGVPQSGFMRALYSSHPETNDRIGKLQELGVPYSRY